MVKTAMVEVKAILVEIKKIEGQKVVVKQVEVK